MDITNRLTFFAALFKVDQNPKVGMWLLYLFIVLLTFVVYKLGFERKLPIIKSLVVYAFLIFGCTILTFFAVFLPIAEGLVVAAIILIIYRLRRWQDEKAKETGI